MKEMLLNFVYGLVTVAIIVLIGYLTYLANQHDWLKIIGGIVFAIIIITVIGYAVREIKRNP